MSEAKGTWGTIFLFLALVVVLTAPFHYAIVNLYPSRIYIGAIMWCPAIAAFITLKLKKREITSLPWDWKNWKYIRLSYLTPTLYCFVTYALIWAFGLGSIANEDVIQRWAKKLVWWVLGI